MPPDAPPLRFLSQSVLDAATVFPADVRPRTLEPSTLEHPQVVEDMRHGYD
jgi:spermidine synthase